MFLALQLLVYADVRPMEVLDQFVSAVARGDISQHITQVLIEESHEVLIVSADIAD